MYEFTCFPTHCICSRTAANPNRFAFSSNRCYDLLLNQNNPVFLLLCSYLWEHWMLFFFFYPFECHILSLLCTEVNKFKETLNFCYSTFWSFCFPNNFHLTHSYAFFRQKNSYKFQLILVVFAFFCNVTPFH